MTVQHKRAVGDEVRSEELDLGTKQYRNCTRRLRQYDPTCCPPAEFRLEPNLLPTTGKSSGEKLAVGSSQAGCEAGRLYLHISSCAAIQLVHAYA